MTLAPAPRIGLFVPSLQGGGTERVMAILARGFARRGLRVDLLVASGDGPYRALLPAEVRVVEFGRRGVFGCIPDLVRYLRRERPDAILAAMSHVNVVALMAHRIARSTARIVVSERTSFIEASKHYRSARDRLIRLLMRLTYGWADRVVVVAKEIADELARSLAVNPASIAAIPNPIVGDDLQSLAQENPDCPLFGQGRPVIVAAGRLSFEKDFETLLRAFALVRRRRDAALVLIGEGPDRALLEQLARRLGIAEHVALPGFVANPFSFMRAADLFVLSSLFEGMPGVVVQAMACGTPVVSTDCRTGPREVLEDGKWGSLVPIRDTVALADAMIKALERENHPDVRRRAEDFTEQVSIDLYLDVVLAENGVRVQTNQ